MITIIKANLLFDGKDKQIIDAAVAIDGSQIIFVGEEQSLPKNLLDKSDTILEYDDATILPGLIDAHVHLTMDGSADPITKTQTDSIPTATIRAMDSAAKLISAGITSVRDCGCQGNISIHLAQAVESGLLSFSPRIVAAGPAICITGGHGAFIGVEADGVDEIRKAVRQVIKDGAGAVKLIASGGVLSRGSKTAAVQLTYDELCAAVEEAEHAGLRTTAHAHATESIKLALRAGVHSIDHASYVDDEIIQLFKEKKAYYIPTLISSVRQMENLDTIPAYIAEKIQRHIDREYDSINQLTGAGIPFAGATDAGTPYNVHGDLYYQLYLLTKQGLTNLEVLRAGTFNSAEAIGIEAETGTLEAQKQADILVVKGNPVKDILALKNVLGVWREGKQLISN